MKKLLNTLYVLTPDSYLFCRNENICVQIGGEEKLGIPAITIDSVVCFGQMTVSTPLLEFCGEHGIGMTFLNRNGTFMGRLCGPVSGNVLLRKKQYECLNDEQFSLKFVKDILFAKICNSKMVLMRHARNDDITNREALYEAARKLGEAAESLSQCTTVDSMRGVEGSAASIYFSQFDQMLSGKTNEFKFDIRSRRPPLNEVNSVLSFVYTIMSQMTQSALETVGLDPAVGYLHSLRPGRASFALDIIEELRAPLCDRFVLSMFNRGQLEKHDFELEEGGVYLNERGRKTVLTSWQHRKEEEIVHPFLDEKIQIGMIPYVQSMLFARVLRGDLDCYPPFVWR